MKDLGGQVASVTGGAAGIGKGIASVLAREGARVVIADTNMDRAEVTAGELRDTGLAAIAVRCDVTRREETEALADRTIRHWGKIDILAANAGMLGILTPLGHLQPKVWDQVMSVNLTANWRLIRAFEPLLKRSDAGRAMFVTSGASRGRFAYWGAYAVSKAALDALVGTWAAETVKTNVRVNLIDPGVVATRRRAEAFPGEDPGKLATPEAVTDTFVELAEAACSRHGEVVRATAG